jgi:hypothetical protein
MVAGRVSLTLEEQHQTSLHKVSLNQLRLDALSISLLSGEDEACT